MSEAIDIEEIAAGLPRRIHEVAARHVSETPDHVALIEDGASWSYRELDRQVTEIGASLKALGIRAGDPMIFVSEKRLPLAALPLAARRLDDLASAANARL